MNWKATVGKHNVSFVCILVMGGKDADWFFLFDIQQKSVNDSYFKPSAFGDSSQNVAEGQDEDFVEEVILMDLFEVKAAEYEDDQEQIQKQEANIFLPSSSPGNTLPRNTQVMYVPCYRVLIYVHVGAVKDIDLICMSYPTVDFKVLI